MQLHLAGHETFYPRQHWLALGIDAIHKEPQIFHRNASWPTDRMGVGINMIRSILHWLRALGLVEKEKAATVKDRDRAGGRVADKAADRASDTAGNRAEDRGSSSGAYYLTNEAQKLLRYDPYLNREETLWILHYNIISNYDRATTWSWFFIHSGLISFTREQFLSRLKLYILQNCSQKLSEKSLEKDLQVLLGMYSSHHNGQGQNSPNSPGGHRSSFYPSPFAKLGLLEQLRDGNRYLRNRQPAIPAKLFLYLILRYLERHQAGVAVVDMRRLSEQPAAPFKAIGVEASRFYELYEDLPIYIQNRLQLSHTAGIWTMNALKFRAEECLQEAYREKEQPDLL